ncbi:MAG: hypothetical protein KDD55_02810 [Bdellovibrionales bacterium]|nr:hypothetical protein [Bdellovibrionales bacterium]
MDENTLKGISKIDSALTSLTGTSSARSNEVVDKNEFITLLVTQLQNQDPLNPMANEEFAVQLAQFTQVEQLIGINEKLAAEQSAGDFSSMASYLGHEVILNSSVVEVENGEGGQVSFDLKEDAMAVTLQLVDSAGVVREEVNLGEMSAGKHSAELSDLTTHSGEFSVQVEAVSTIGAPFQTTANVSGIVSGYVPGPDPVLLVGDREIGTSEIQEVRVPGVS